MVVEPDVDRIGGVEPGMPEEQQGPHAHEEGEDGAREESRDEQRGGVARGGMQQDEDRERAGDDGQRPVQGLQVVLAAGEVDEEAQAREGDQGRPADGAQRRHPARHGDGGEPAGVEDEMRRGQQDHGERGIDHHFVVAGIERRQQVEAAAGAQVGEGFEDVGGDFQQVAVDRMHVEQGEVGPQEEIGERAAQRRGARHGQPEAAEIAQQAPAGGEEGRAGEGQDQEEEDGLVQLAGRLQPPGQGHAAGVADGRPLEIADHEEKEQRQAEAELHVEFDRVADAVGQQDEQHGAQPRGAPGGAQRVQQHPETQARQRPEKDENEVVDEQGVEIRQAEEGGRRHGLGPMQGFEVERARMRIVHVGVAVGRQQVAGEDGTGDEFQFPGVERRIPVVERGGREVRRPGPGDRQHGDGQQQQDQRRLAVGHPGQIAPLLGGRNHSRSASFGFLQNKMP